MAGSSKAAKTSAFVLSHDDCSTQVDATLGIGERRRLTDEVSNTQPPTVGGLTAQPHLSSDGDTDL